jgi:hypothetical protein
VVRDLLKDHGHHAAHVVDILEPGVDDMPDVLPYAQEHVLIIVTKDVLHFERLDDSVHCGLIFVFNHRLSGREIATGIQERVEAYPSRDAFRAYREQVDDWI